MARTAVFALLICAIVFGTIGISPVAAAAPGTSSPSIPSFSACIKRDIQILPQAKKLSPANYQKFETDLNSAFNWWGIKFLQQNKYLDAIITGAQIGKFMGYDFIWALGMVQDCWRYL